MAELLDAATRLKHGVATIVESVGTTIQQKIVDAFGETDSMTGDEWASTSSEESQSSEDDMFIIRGRWRQRHRKHSRLASIVISNPTVNTVVEGRYKDAIEQFMDLTDFEKAEEKRLVLPAGLEVNHRNRYIYKPISNLYLEACKQPSLNTGEEEVAIADKSGGERLLFHDLKLLANDLVGRNPSDNLAEESSDHPCISEQEVGGLEPVGGGFEPTPGFEPPLSQLPLSQSPQRQSNQFEQRGSIDLSVSQIGTKVVSQIPAGAKNYRQLLEWCFYEGQSMRFISRVHRHCEIGIPMEADELGEVRREINDKKAGLLKETSSRRKAERRLMRLQKRSEKLFKFGGICRYCRSPVMPICTDVREWRLQNYLGVTSPTAFLYYK